MKQILVIFLLYLISFLDKEYINLVKYLNTDQNAELFLDYYSISNYSSENKANKSEYNISNNIANYLELQLLITKYLITSKNKSLPNILPLLG